MIKLIDAKKNLSMQVHPDDEYALKNEGQYGKTEAWYVLDAKEGSYEILNWLLQKSDQKLGLKILIAYNIII